MKIHDLITTTDRLADLCERLGKGNFVCVDTEFMRENTYWPELCLVQIGNEEEAAAVRPLPPMRPRAAVAAPYRGHARSRGPLTARGAPQARHDARPRPPS